jgi:hypothetical protein
VQADIVGGDQPLQGVAAGSPAPAFGEALLRRGRRMLG